MHTRSPHDDGLLLTGDEAGRLYLYDFESHLLPAASLGGPGHARRVAFAESWGHSARRPPKPPRDQSPKLAMLSNGSFGVGFFGGSLRGPSGGLGGGSSSNGAGTLGDGGAAAAAVNAVGWSCAPSGQVFGSVGDDGRTCVWDRRQPGSGSVGGAARPSVCLLPPPGDGRAPPSASAAGEVRCLAFSPTHEHLLATGGEGGRVCAWDFRAPKAPLASLLHLGNAAETRSSSRGGAAGASAAAPRSGVVGEVSWVPGEPSLLVSAAAHPGVRGGSGAGGAGPAPGRKWSETFLWDLARLPANGSTKETDSASADGGALLLNHRNHDASEVMDLSVSADSALVASVDSANTLDIWRVSRELLCYN